MSEPQVQEANQTFTKKQPNPKEQAYTMLVMQAGDNLTRLIGMQEQQMIYINSLFSSITNEQNVTQQQQASKPVDNGSRTEKDQTISGKSK